MIRNQIATALAVACIGVLSACNEGLAPLNEPAGFKGVITYKNWPPPDSMLELRLVAFTEYPSDSSGILTALLSGRAVVYPPVTEGVERAGMTLGKFRDSVHYDFSTKGTTLQLGTYNYLVVAWRYGPNFFADWRPAGVYTTTPGSFVPGQVRVLLHKVTPDIDIAVDFRNLPPKPWR